MAHPDFCRARLATGNDVTGAKLLAVFLPPGSAKSHFAVSAPPDRMTPIRWQCH